MKNVQRVCIRRYSEFLCSNNGTYVPRLDIYLESKDENLGCGQCATINPDAASKEYINKLAQDMGYSLEQQDILNILDYINDSGCMWSEYRI